MSENRQQGEVVSDARFALTMAQEALARRSDLTFEELEAWALDVAVMAGKRARRGLRGGNPFDQMRGMVYRTDSLGKIRRSYPGHVIQGAESRDPRMDPVVGDVVRKKDRIREVVAVGLSAGNYPGEITYDTMRDGSPKMQRRSCWISTWQEWCRKAEVVKRGDAS